MSAISWPQGAFAPEMKQRIANAKLLVVGAGGIGCELLKTLVLTGFKHIEAIDLDTIEISNLNRQFLFRKHHVGHSKSSVAAAAVKRFRPDVDITAHQANVKESKYDIDFFRGFDVVLNGLDNLDARRHVNRMCLSAKIPLIESGTAGYLGQVSVHVGGVTECFDCQAKPTPKSYAVCTIRTSPDKPIHCVVWAKDLLFPLLFGPKDEESDLDPKGALSRAENESTDEYVARVFRGMFTDKIQEVLDTAEKEVWEGKTPPQPLGELYSLLAEKGDGGDGVSIDASVSCTSALGLTDQNAVWTPQQSASVFLETTRRILDHRSQEVGALSFDKDDDMAVEFVTAAANLRSLCYHIPAQSLFDTKGMAGNIIHAIATTNAIISGLIVVEALKLLAADSDPVACKTTFLRQDLSSRKLITPIALEPPNPGCVVCGTAQLQLRINCRTTTFSEFLTGVLRGHLGLVEPTLMFGSATSMFQYEEGEDLDDEEVEENAAYLPRLLCDLPGGGMVHNCVVEVKDQKQNVDVQIVVCHQEEWDEVVHPHRFSVEGEVPLAKTEEEEKDEEKEGVDEEGAAAAVEHGAALVMRKMLAFENDDGAMVLVESDEDEGPAKATKMDSRTKKRKLEDDGDVDVDDDVDDGVANQSKRAKRDIEEDDDVIELLD